MSPPTLDGGEAGDAAGIGDAGLDEAGPGPAGRGPSTAIVVDDLVTWIVAGLQPTGIQRVVVGLLDAAETRPDLDIWPAMSVAGIVAGDAVRLTRVDRRRLVWQGPTDHVATRLRLLRGTRGLVQRVAMPAALRRAAKRTYGRLALAGGGMAAGGSADPAKADLLLVPGGFWSGDAADRLVALADRGVRLRVVVYDLFPIRDPDWCVPQLRVDFRRAVDQVLPLCDRVVTLCDEVAGQVVEEFPALAGRVRVGVPTMAAHAPRPVPSESAVPSPVDGPFVLSLSTVEPRKNIRAIVDAWRIVRTDPRAADVRLVVAGRRGWMSDDLEAEIARDGEALGIVRLDHVSDAEVDALYHDCLATVHASWAEGFGLPARESVVRGIPTLMSDRIPRDGLPDGTYALFDPTDPAALAVLMLDVIERRPARTPVDLGPGTGWEPVLSALVD